jgi:predicted ATP-binding protein involved in virulence
MADGYSSFLRIVIELMMKMEKKASMTYDLPGIVLIDEIEAHLHIELQKRVLPFLMTMFPRIQFIVTTHSPFIITSVSNAIVYDLEKKIAVKDMSSYSYKAVIEHYYDINTYSEEINKQFEIYKNFINKDNLSSDEMEQLINAMTYLGQIPVVGVAEELVYSFREMEAKRRKKGNDQA